MPKYNSDYRNSASRDSGDDDTKITSSIHFELTPIDNQRLVNLCGTANQNITQLEDYYDVNINCRSNQFEVTGEGRRLKIVKNAIQTLYNVAGHENVSGNGAAVSDG